MKRWTSWLRRDSDSLTWEIDDELDEHIAQRVEDNLTRGLSPREAHAEARRRFGSKDRAASASRRYRGRTEALHRALAFDLCDAWRAVRRSPATSITGLVVVAVGLGAVFGASRLADALLARAPGGVAAPSDLLSISESFDGEHPQLLTRPAFEAVVNGVPDATPFAWSERSLQVIHPRGSLVATANFVSSGYFRALGVGTTAGRALTEDDQAAERPVVVVSTRLATRFADAAPDAVGVALSVAGRPFTVVGVADPRFRGLESGHPIDLWLPVSTEPLVSAPTVFPDGSVYQGFWSTPGIGWLRAAMRRPEGGNLEALTDRATAALRQGDPSPRNDTRTPIVEPRPWISPFSGDRDRIEAVMAPVGWAMACTLLLTAACLGSLYVGRASDRRREYAMRLALGAERRRLARLAGFEIAVVVVAGCLMATAASELLLGIIGGLQLTPGVTVADALSPLDLRAVGQLALLGTVLAAVAAAMPVAFVRQTTPRGSPGAESRTTSSGHRLRRTLMAAQVAAGTALLGAAGLLTSSISELTSRPIGFDASRVAYVHLDPAGAGLAPDEVQQLAARALLVTPAPRAAVAIADGLPFQRSRSRFLYGPDSDWERAFPVPTTLIGGPYFEAMGIRLVAGRRFTPADRSRPVAILSETLAQALWPGAPAVGRTVMVGGVDGAPHEVVGVAESLRDTTLRGDLSQRIYLPFDASAETLAIVARPAAETAAGLVTPLRRAAEALEQRLVVLGAGTVEMLAGRTIQQRELFRLLTAMLGLGSLIMVAAGVWGLSHGTLRQRWREFGVRQALGAGRYDVARLACSDATFVSLTGGCLGLAAGWQFGRLLEAWLFGVQPWDPVSLGLAALLVAGSAVAGAVQPAARASRIDPATLLRQS